MATDTKKTKKQKVTDTGTATPKSTKKSKTKDKPVQTSDSSAKNGTDSKPTEKKEFMPSRKFKGSKNGYVFYKGPKGVGYYIDVKPVVNFELVVRSNRGREKNNSRSKSAGGKRRKSPGGRRNR